MRIVQAPTHAEKRSQMKNIGDVLAKHRKNKHLSQIDIAARLQAYGIHVKNAAVSSWEKNTNTPTAAQLLALCEILEISDSKWCWLKKPAPIGFILILWTGILYRI